MTQRLTKRSSLWLLLLLVLLLAAQLAMIQLGPDATAHAVAAADVNGQAGGSSNPADPGGAAGTNDASAASAQAEGTGTADGSTSPAQVKATGATDAAVDPLATRASVERRAATVSLKSTTKIDSRLAAIARRVDASVATDGSRAVAARLAARFGMTPEELRAEKAELGASWGQLMIAHALAANSSMTVDQLLAMHADGMGWGKIAAGLGIKLGAAVRGVNASAHAAQGMAKAGGHVSATRGAGARAGVHGGVSGGLVAANARAGVGAGVGLRIGH
jgi:hypothetical protein